MEKMGKLLLVLIWKTEKRSLKIFCTTKYNKSFRWIPDPIKYIYIYGENVLGTRLASQNALWSNPEKPLYHLQFFSLWRVYYVKWCVINEDIKVKVGTHIQVLSRAADCQS